MRTLLTSQYHLVARLNASLRPQTETVAAIDALLPAILNSAFKDDL